ncbi:MAG: hypothetical protein IAI50_19465, partial [Candidatus Eremiobacteraeota bacterium]|nr:hypothetical protein [Candidatus Eremiobacteraeota bacterium]
NSPGTNFYSVTHGILTPPEALERLDSADLRVLLKRPEKYDPRFRELLQAIFQRIVDLRGGLRGEKLVRLDGSVLVSSAATITPFHFDPEVSFFFQIEGEKLYHLFAPSVLTEPELEQFYVKSIVDIGELRFAGRDRAREHVFALRPNFGMHQPQKAPHWVETSGSRSISYVVSFETDATRARGRTRSFNHYLRKAGMTPQRVGSDPARDAMKAGAMRAFVPARKQLGNTLRKALGR